LDLIGDTEYVVYDDMYFIYCPDDDDYSGFESLYLKMDDYWFEVPAENYIFDYDETDGEGNEICLIGLVEGSSYWLAGDVFLRSYYQIYDDDNAQMTLAPRLNGAVTDIIYDP